LLLSEWRYLILRPCTPPGIKLRSLPSQAIPPNRVLIEAIELDILVNAVLLLLLVDESVVDFDLLSHLAILFLL
jgi:hypothetical protein